MAEYIEREALKKSEETVFNAIADFIDKCGYPPSIRELCTLTGLSSTCSVYKCLKSLEAKGYIEINKNHKRALSIIAPAADVVEVKHGVWQEIDNLVIEHGLPTVKGKTWRCSICGEARKNHTAPDMNYCPNCGAKMDKKEGAEE